MGAGFVASGTWVSGRSKERGLSWEGAIRVKVFLVNTVGIRGVTGLPTLGLVAGMVLVPEVVIDEDDDRRRRLERYEIYFGVCKEEEVWVSTVVVGASGVGEGGVVGVVIIDFVKIKQVYRGLKGPKNTRRGRKVLLRYREVPCLKSYQV